MSSEAEKPTQAVDLPLRCFPFTIEYLDGVGGAVLHKETIQGPGVMQVPSARSLGVQRVETRVTYGDGVVINSWDED